MKRPPIQGMPAVREVCRGCEKKLKPMVRNEHPARENGIGQSLEITARHFMGWSSYLGFHTLTCALYFADAAYRSGYRKKPLRAPPGG